MPIRGRSHAYTRSRNNLDHFSAIPVDSDCDAMPRPTTRSKAAASKTEASKEKKETVQPGKSKKAKKDEVAVPVAKLQALLKSVKDLLPPESDENDKKKQEKQKIWLVQCHSDDNNEEWEYLTTMDYNKAKRKFNEEVAKYSGYGNEGEFETGGNGEMTWRESEGSDKAQRFELKFLLLDDDDESSSEPESEDDE